MSDENFRIELFIFPDGTSVEMMVFDENHRRPLPRVQPKVAPAVCEDSPAPAEDPDAHHCVVCGSRLVYPLDWERSGKASWILVLRCPECETRREVRLGRASVEEFNRELYHGSQEIAREADLMTRRNFEEEAEKLIAALERDLILPMDF